VEVTAGDRIKCNIIIMIRGRVSTKGRVRLVCEGWSRV